MGIVERLKPLFFGIAVAAGFLAIWILEPLSWFDGYVLFMLGVSAGQWSQQINPASETELGPVLPWDEMGDAERFTYFLPAITFAVFGCIFLGVVIHWSRTEIDWLGIASAIGVLAMGGLIAYLKWRNRYD